MNYYIRNTAWATEASLQLSPALVTNTVAIVVPEGSAHLEDLNRELLAAAATESYLLLKRSWFAAIAGVETTDTLQWPIVGPAVAMLIIFYLVQIMNCATTFVKGKDTKTTTVEGKAEGNQV